MADLNLENIDLGGFGLNDEDPQQTQLNANMNEAIKVDPVQHAKTTQLSQESGVPEFAVKSDPAQVEHKLKLDKINLEGMTQRAPKTSKYLTDDVNNSVIAQEDVISNLLEGIEKTFDGMGRSIGISFESQAKGALLAGNEGTSDRIEDLIPASAMPMGMEADAMFMSRELAANFGIETDEQLTAAKLQTSERLIGEIQSLDAERKLLTPKDMNIVQEGVRAGVESLANMAPGFSLMVLSGGRAAPLLTTIGAQTFSGSFGKGRAEGLNSEEAAWFASIDAAIEVGTELIPLKTLSTMLTGSTKGFTKGALKFAVQEMGTEQLATALQTVNSYAFGLDKELENATTTGEMIEIQLRRQAVTAIATIVAGGTQIAAVGTVKKTVAKLTQTEQQQENQGEVEQRNLDKLSADSDKSKLKERDVESFKQFVREADGENNTNVFIDGVQTSLYLQSKTPEEVQDDPALTMLANAMRESRATGTDIAIPIDDFMGDITGTESFVELREHMTMSDETVSPFRQEQHKVETESYVETLIAEAEENASEYVEAQEIYTSVRDQLIDTGAVNSANASIMAQMVPAWATAQARRSGKSVQQVYSDAGLTIEGPQSGELSRLEGEQVLTQENLTPITDITSEGSVQVDSNNPFLFDFDPNTFTVRESVFKDVEGDTRDPLKLKPITVTVRDGETVILDGHHRTKIAQETGNAVRAVVIPAEDVDAMEADGVHPAEMRSEWVASGKMSGRKQQEQFAQSPLKSVDLIDFSDQQLAVKMVELDAGTPLFNEFDTEQFPHVDTVKKESGQSPVLGFHNMIRNSYVMGDGTVYRANHKTGNVTKVDEIESRNFLKNKIFSAQRKAEPTVEEVQVESVQEQIQEAADKIEITDREAADTNSSEFKNWFDDSVVTKEDGSPLTVYHGTRAAVDDSFVFDYSRIGEQGRAEGAGFYFTPNKNVADGYADNGATLEVYLSIQNPIDFNQEGFEDEQLFNIVKRIAELEAIEDEASIADGFLSNFGDVSFEGVDSVIQNAADLMSTDTALDQLSGMVGAGVGVEVVNRATQEITGHDGVVSQGFSGQGGKDDPLIYVAFFPEQIKSAQNIGKFDPKSPDIFKQNQPDTDAARGYYDPENSIIRLTEASDLSTFLHEFAHFMYEMEASGNTDMNESINNWYKRNGEEVAAEATKNLNGNFDAIKQGERTNDNKQTVTEADVVNYLDTGSSGSKDKDAAVRRAVHEQFARGFETYLMEGKAPSVELRNAFRTFARWLGQIYQSLRGDLNVKLDAEMREVFDRLLATEEQIAAAESRARVEPMFTDAAMAGMTEEEFSDYQQRQEKVKDVQTETLRDQMIKALTRKTKKWWNEEKSDVIDEEMGRLSTEQVYSTAARLRDGDIKLDTASVKEIAGEERTDKLGRKSIRVSDKLRGMTAKGQKGVHPDEAAAFLGYSSGAEMLNELMTAPPIKETAETNAEAIMVERHGDIFTDGTIEQQADEAVQNEERGKLILHELKILARGTNQRTLDRQTVKTIAEERIGNLSFKEIHPGKYRKAEVRAAQESARMLAEGNKDGAAQAKARQSLNYYLGMAATEAKNETVKIVDRMGRYNKKKVREEIQKAEGGYWGQIVKILERFEFRKTASLASVDQVNQDINTWAKERMDIDGDGLVLHNAVLNESYVTHWKNVAYSDLQGVNDSVKNIEHVARYANKLTRMGEEIEYNKLVDKLVTTAAETGTGRFKKSASVADDLSWVEAKGRWSMAQMSKIPYMMSWMDGMDRVGTWFTTFSQPMTDAYSAELELFKEVGEPVIDMIKNRSKADEKRHNTTFFIPEIKDTAGGTHTGNLKGHEIVAVALNTGNAGNLRKLLLGEQWATEDSGDISLENPKLQAVLKHMTESDWNMVQTIWDQIDILYPKLAEVHRRTTGLVPPKVEATPVVTDFGTFKGGYYPVKYDPTRDNKAAEFEERKDAEVGSMFASNASIQSSVNTGSTNERTGYFAPMHLTLNVVPNHIQETIHYITHHDAVREVNRLLRDPRVKDAVTSKLGPEEFAQLKPWLNDIAKDGRNAPNKSIVDAMFNKLRLGTTLGVMGFKASTGIIQISGLSNTIAEVGMGPVMQSMRTILGSPSTIKSAWEFANEKSKVLKHRTKTMDREMMNAMQQLESKRGVLAAVQEASMKHIAYIQTYMVDLPSWHAAYIKELSESGDEAKAFQYADWVIENVQGSGVTKDMAALMRNQTKTHTIFTMFMTFFSALWNLQRDMVKGGKSGAYSTTTLAAKTMFLFTIPVLFEMIMRGEFAKEDEEPEELLQKSLTKVALYPITSIPFVRDVVNGVFGGYGYNASPVTSIVEQGLQGLQGAGKAVLADDELTKSQVKSISKLAGAGLGVPGTGQAWATGEHLYDVLAEGEEFTTHQFLFGPARK